MANAQLEMLAKEKLSALEKLNALSKEQLTAAQSEEEEALEALDALVASRGEVMAGIDAIDQKVQMLGGPEGLPPAVRDAMRAVLVEIASRDKQIIAAVEQKLSSSGVAMRTARQTRQGVNAYMNAQAPVDSMFIDKKK